MNYILDSNRNPIGEPNLSKWAKWFETGDRIVRQEMVGESKVSTVFLGMDHAFGGGPPVLWETMVFGGELNGEQIRCTGNLEQAEAMHRTMVERVRDAEVTK